MTTQRLSILLFATVLAALTSSAQKITIDKLPPPSEFDKTDDSRAITSDIIKKKNITIAVAQKLKIKSISYKKDEDFVELKTDTKTPITGLTKYVLPADRKFSGGKIALELKGSDGKHYDFSIAAGEDKGETIAEETDTCIEKKKEEFGQNLSFIRFNKLAIGTDCDTGACTACPDTYPYLATYNFRNNTITQKKDKCTTETSNKKKDKKKKSNPDDCTAASRIIIPVGAPIVLRIQNANPELYDVTISDSTVNYNQDWNSLIDLLNGGVFATAAGANAVAKAQNANCTLTLNDKVTVATGELVMELSRLKARLQNLSPYYDAYCYRTLLKMIREQIDFEIDSLFKTDHMESFDDLVTYIKANQDASAKTDFATSFNDGYQKLLTPHFGFEYKIPAVDNVDELVFKFNILPKDKDAALPVVNNGMIKVYTKNGTKVDISSGLYFAFLKNHVYTIRADSNATSHYSRMYKENPGFGAFGFSSFMHVYKRSGKNVNHSGIIGAGVSFNEHPQVRYFAGYGLLVGRADRFGVNLGLAFGNVNELSAQYANQTTLSYDEAGKDPVYIKRFKARPFFSLTYNLSFLKKKDTQTVTATADTGAAGGSTTAKTDTGAGNGDSAGKTDTTSKGK